MTALAQQSKLLNGAAHPARVDFVIDSGPASAMFLAITPDAEDWAQSEFTHISKEYLGVWLFSSEAARAIVQELLDRGFRVKLNGGLL
jgi:hypothetical protein